MRKATRMYLNEKMLEVYETIDELKSKCIHNTATDDDMIKLSVAESELNIIKFVLETESNHTK